MVVTCFEIASNGWVLVFSHGIHGRTRKNIFEISSVKFRAFRGKKKNIMSKPDYYEALGVSKTAADGEIMS